MTGIFNLKNKNTTIQLHFSAGYSKEHKYDFLLLSLAKVRENKLNIVKELIV